MSSVFYVDGMFVRVISETKYSVLWVATGKNVECNAGDSAGNGGFTRITFGVGHVVIRRPINRKIHRIDVTDAEDGYNHNTQTVIFGNGNIEIVTGRIATHTISNKLKLYVANGIVFCGIQCVNAYV